MRVRKRLDFWQRLGFESLSIHVLRCHRSRYYQVILGFEIYSSSRFIVFDHDGSIISVAQKEHEQIMPHPGWVEHDPIMIIQNVEVVKSVRSKA